MSCKEVKKYIHDTKLIYKTYVSMLYTLTPSLYFVTYKIKIPKNQKIKHTERQMPCLKANQIETGLIPERFQGKKMRPRSFVEKLCMHGHT